MRGDQAAQNDLVSACLPRVRTMVHGQLQHDFRKHHRWMLAMFSTGDIVQDVLVRVLPELGDVAIASEDDLVRYLATLVRHRLVDTVRYYEAKRRDQRRHARGAAEETAVDGPPARTSTPQELAAWTEQIEIFHRVLSEFSTRHRLLLEMRLEDEQGYAQIAEQLGYASEESARQAFVDAHARLLVKLRAHGLRATDGSRG